MTTKVLPRRRTTIAPGLRLRDRRDARTFIASRGCRRSSAAAADLCSGVASGETMTRATVDPVVRDTAIASLVLGSPRTVVVRHDLLPDDGALRRVVIDATGVVEDLVVPLAHACVLCSMREDAVPTLARLAASGRWTDLVLALTVPPLPVAPWLR